MAFRDDSGPGAQSRLLSGSLRDNHQGVDPALVLPSRPVLHDPAGLHAMEPSADHRLLRVRPRRTQARRSPEYRSSGSLRRSEPGDAERDGIEGTAGLPSAPPAALSADLGAAYHRAVDKVGGRARAQRLL